VVIDPKDIELKTARSGGARGKHIVLCRSRVLGFLYCSLTTEHLLTFQSMQCRMLTRWRRLLILFTSLQEVQKRDHSYRTKRGHFNCGEQNCKLL
jgi:hypothetical protein